MRSEEKIMKLVTAELLIRPILLANGKGKLLFLLMQYSFGNELSLCTGFYFKGDRWKIVVAENIF